MSANTPVPPPVSWAQRRHLLYVIINVECKDVDYKFTEDSMYFKGTSISENKDYEMKMNFLHKINPDKVTNKNISRCLEFTINKAESGPYWPTLTNDKKKPHFLKVDFNKWVDDEASDDEGVGDPNEFFNKIDAMKGMNNTFNDEEEEEEDSDDEALPPLVMDNNQ